MKQILLIEKDPFVRTDMQQALELALPEHRVSAHVELEEVALSIAPLLLLIDTSAMHLREQFAARHWSCRDVICILTGASKPGGSDNFIHLPRPFTETMLISTALDALGSLEGK